MMNMKIPTCLQCNGDFFKHLMTMLFKFVGLVRMISRATSIESFFIFLAFTGFMQMASIMGTTSPIQHSGYLFTEGCRVHPSVSFEIFTDSVFKTMFFPSLKNVSMQLGQRHTSEIDMVIFQELFNCIWDMNRKASKVMFQICWFKFAI